MLLDLIAPPGGAGAFPAFVLLLVALLVEAYVGSLKLPFLRIPHPVRVIGGLIGWLDRKLNREQRPESDRALRGAFAATFVVGLAATAGWGVAWLTANHDFGWIVELVLLVALLAQRSLYDHVRAVARALKSEGLAGGRAAVAHIVGRDVRQLDEHGVARAAIESCMENFSDAVVAPCFWYLLFGFPGLLAYKAVNTMDSMIGYRTPKHRAFGMTAARLDDAMNLAPARLAAAYLALAAAFVPGAGPSRSLRIALRDARRHRSPNAGWPEAAAAGALGLALAGPRRYQDGVINDPWIGDGRARATPRDIERALYLYAVACLVNAAVVALIAFAGLTLT